MPRFNVSHKDKWACFSTIVDGFITPFMGKDDYEEWRLEEYGASNFVPAEKCNMMTIEKAVSAIKLNRSLPEAMSCLEESGLSKPECLELFNGGD